MILTLCELEGKALEWMYERALGGSYEGMKTENGYILIHLNDDVNPPGWYYYKSDIHDEEDVHAVREMIRCLVGEGPFVVPTDLCSPKYAHIQHEKIKDSFYPPKERWKRIHKGKCYG